jgi:hypothetical protein
VSFTITRSCMCKMYWAEPHFIGLNWHMNVVVVHFIQNIRLCKAQMGGVAPLKQCRIQFLHKSHMSTKCLTLNAYIFITIRPWLKDLCLGELFLRPPHVCTSVIKLINLLVWLKKETITWVLGYRSQNEATMKRWVEFDESEIIVIQSPMTHGLDIVG